MLDPSIVSEIKIEKKNDVDIIRLDPGNRDQLASLSEFVADFDIAGVVHTSPCTLAGMAWAEITSKQQTNMVCHGLFGVLKAVDSKLGNRDDGFVISVSALDGRHGNGGHRFNALGAGAHGIVKSYARERENLRCRALDVSPELLVNPEEMAETVLRELHLLGPREIGIDSDGRRWRVCMYDEALEDEPFQMESDDVYLVSGGGSGVTAACTIGLSEFAQGVGTHFALLGRTKLDKSVVDWVGEDDESLANRKMMMRDDLQAESEDGKVTIVQWEDAWSKTMRSLDIYRTIAAIEETGNTASYHSCDVTNGNQLRSVVKKVHNNHGAVTGIIHGAGLEDSKLIADKDWKTFDRVVSVKIDGWQALVNAAKDNGANLRFCCAFTSIAGRFGNGGQVDYAAANSILDAEMSRLSHTENEPRAVAIAWTGWRDVGMATKGSIEKVFAAAGIETVSVEKGVQLFVDEVTRGGKRRVVIAGKLGALDDDGSEREPPQRVTAEVASLLDDAKRFPFVDKIVELDQHNSLAYECTLDKTRYPFLVDHAIDEVPYHPGVMALEMFAQGAQLLWPACEVIGFEDASFGLPVKVMKEEQKVRVRAKLSHQSDNMVWVECTLESDLVNKAGEVFGEPRIHHTTKVKMLKRGGEKGLLNLPEVGLPHKGGASYAPSFVYKRFFHGRRFQSHGGISKGFMLDDSYGCDGVALMRHQLPNVELFEGEVDLEALPMVIEACFQNAGMLAMEIDKLQSLPVGIASLDFHNTPEEDDSLRVRSVRLATEEGGVTVHDCLVTTIEGRPIISLKGLRLKGMSPVQKGHEFSLVRN